MITKEVTNLEKLIILRIYLLSAGLIATIIAIFLIAEYILDDPIIKELITEINELGKTNGFIKNNL